MVDEEVKKFVEKKLQRFRAQLNEDLRKTQIFADAYLLILLDLALIDDPRKRITRVLSAVSHDFPQPILEIFVKKSVSKAKESKIDFEDFADCLIKGLGDRLKEIELVDEIVRVYGFREGERWKNIVRSSNSSNNPNNLRARGTSISTQQNHTS